MRFSNIAVSFERYMTRKKFLLPLNLDSLRDLNGFVAVFHAEIAAKRRVQTDLDGREGFRIDSLSPRLENFHVWEAGIGPSQAWESNSSCDVEIPGCQREVHVG